MIGIQNGKAMITAIPDQPLGSFYTSKADADDRLGSKHPTVKPLDLMQYLVRLVTPKRVLFCPKCDTLNHAEITANPSENQAVRFGV